MKMRIILGLCLLVVSLLFIFPTATLAQEETIELTTPYSKLEGESGSSFEFEVTLNYMGSETRNFNLSAVGPAGWTTYITPSYPQDKIIGDIRLEPWATSGNRISVFTISPSWAEPGEYEVTVEASSGEIQDTLIVTPVISAKYEISLTTPDSLLSTKATAGKDNYFALVVTNTGSAAVDNITFSSDKPSGWIVEFSPVQIDSLIAGGSQTIDVNIKPGAKAIAGDYEVNLAAKAEKGTAEVSIRVTVETPTVWGWVGVAIIVLVVAGLAFVFMRFSRR
jgi:uncharacterized membrane protein